MNRSYSDSSNFAARVGNRSFMCLGLERPLFRVKDYERLRHLDVGLETPRKKSEKNGKREGENKKQCFFHCFFPKKTPKGPFQPSNFTISQRQDFLDLQAKGNGQRWYQREAMRSLEKFEVQSKTASSSSTFKERRHPKKRKKCRGKKSSLKKKKTREKMVSGVFFLEFFRWGWCQVISLLSIPCWE